MLAKEESLRWVVVTLPCPVVMAVGRPTRSCLLMSSCVTGISRVDWPRKVHRQISASKPLFQNPILCACRDAKIPPNCWSRIDRRTLLFCCRVTPSLPLGFTSDNRFLRLFFFVRAQSPPDSQAPRNATCAFYPYDLLQIDGDRRA